MSLAYEKLGDRDQAVTLAEKALQIFEEVEDSNAEKVRRQLVAWRRE